MKNKIINYLLIFLCVSNLNASLTLEQSIDLLYKNNLEIKNSNFEINLNKLTKKIGESHYYGSLDLTQDVMNSNDAGNVFGFKLTSRDANFGDFGAKEFTANSAACQGGSQSACDNLYNKPPDELNNPNSRTLFQTKINYKIPLFTGFKLEHNNDILSSMLKLSELNKEQLVNQKIFELKKSFYNVKLLNESLYNLNIIFNNMENLEFMTTELYKEGYVRKIDIMEVKSKKLNIKRMIYEINSNKELLYSFISFLINEEVKEIIVPKNDISFIEEGIDNIVSNNINIQKANIGLKINKSMIGINKSNFLPEVGAFAEVGTASDTFLGNAVDNVGYTVGVRLNWNIYNSGIDDINLEKSRLKYLQSESKLNLAKKGISLKIRKLIIEIKNLNKSVELSNVEKELSKNIYNHYLERYKEKLSTISEVIIKQSMNIENTLECLRLKNRMNQKILELEKIKNGEK